jgi:hypothetical protein
MLETRQQILYTRVDLHAKSGAACLSFCWQQSKLQTATLSHVNVYYYAHWLIVACNQLLATLFTATCIQ